MARDAEKKRASDKRYHLKNKPARTAYHKKWRSENKELLSAYSYQYRLDLKLAILSHYGVAGKCQCCWPDCAVTDIDMLSLDHVDNDGNVKRKESGILGGYPLYVKLRKDGYPEGFQTLCLNHQMKKAIVLLRQTKGRLSYEQPVANGGCAAQ